jgi:hypothetical protein
MQVIPDSAAEPAIIAGRKGDKMAKHKMSSARNMPDAANADNSLEGYAAINQMDDAEEIRQLAYKFYEDRNGEEGSPDDDWFRAEQEVRRRRYDEQALNRGQS